MVLAIPVMRGPVFCGGRLRDGSGRTCRQPAGKNTDHPRYGRCNLHGGCTKTQRQHAQMLMIQDAAVLYGVPREVDPVVGLMEEYWRTLGVVEALEAMVAQLSPSEIWWGVQSIEESEAGASDGGEESLTPPERKVKSGAALNLQVKLFNEERDRSVRIAETILKLDLEGRRVELDQAHLVVLAKVLFSAELGLSQDQLRVVARLLRGVEVRAEIAA